MLTDGLLLSPLHKNPSKCISEWILVLTSDWANLFLQTTGIFKMELCDTVLLPEPRANLALRGPVWEPLQELIIHWNCSKKSGRSITHLGAVEVHLLPSLIRSAFMGGKKASYIKTIKQFISKLALFQQKSNKNLFLLNSEFPKVCAECSYTGLLLLLHSSTLPRSIHFSFVSTDSIYGFYAFISEETAGVSKPWNPFPSPCVLSQFTSKKTDSLISFMYSVLCG